MSSPPEPVRSRPRAFALIGQVVALLIALFCFLVTAWFLYDIAYLSHPPNDWGDPAQFDLLFAGIINLPGWIVALALAAFIRPFRRGLVLPTYVLAAAELALLAQTSHAFALNKARQQKRTDALVQQMERSSPAGKRP